MTRTYSALPHLNGNLLAAIDVETTGTRPRYHEIVQIAIVPLNSDIRPLEGMRPFYHSVKPLYPERADHRATNVHGLDLGDLILNAPDADKVADWLIEWYEKLELPFEKGIVPLAHNWAFEAGFLKAWLGVALVDKLFIGGEARDGMITARYLNDKAVFAGEKAPFSRCSLGVLCNHFNVVNEKAHDAYADCLAEAEVYRCLLHMDA